MINYIEEMMETAGVNLVVKYPNLNFTEVSNTFTQAQYAEENYPAFTAEKQLEIIKLIIENNGFCGFTNFRDKDKWSISCGFTFPIGPKPEKGINFNPTFRKCETFDQALAQLTTELINAGELDKKKVKGILEG